MSNRAYRLSLGLLILFAMYFELEYVMWVMIGIVFLEGLSNWRVPLCINKAMNLDASNPLEGTLGVNFPVRLNFDAERGWRLLVSSLLFLTYVLFYEMLWFFPWFMGFAILGAGISGVCPMFLMLKWFGLK